MPNYCDNKLIVSGPTSEVMRFINDVQGSKNLDGDTTDLDMSRLLPAPEEICDPDPNILSREEYDWRVEHWGTKWDVDTRRSVETENGESKATYGFWSAWAPIVPFVEYAAEQYPDLTFTLSYAEGGMAFAGRWTNDPDDYSWETSYDDFVDFCKAAIGLGFESYEDDLTYWNEERQVGVNEG